MTCAVVLPITIDIEVVDPAAVITAGFDQIQIHRSTTGEGGPYAEITGPGTRLVLNANVTEYSFEDTKGSDEYFYKYRFFNSTTLAEDTFSAAQPGALDPSLAVCSIEELKTFYLFGIDLTDDKGQPYPDRLYAHYIKAAVSWLEHRIDIPIIPKRYVHERHDYYKYDYNKYIWLKLDHYPIIGVEDVQLVLPGEQVVQVFEQDWYQLQRAMGQFQLVPGTGTAGSILLGASGAWLPYIYGGNKFIPNTFRVTYEAGFGKPSSPDAHTIPDPDLDSFPGIIKELVGKVASFGPLNIAGDLLGGAGIASQSIGIDGLSQSFATTSSATNAGYGARIVSYRKELKEQIPKLQAYYKGLRLQVV